ncbi:MAG: gliding motility-associated C-terminal domain-containing protein [Bacteroidota bacterium]
MKYKFIIILVLLTAVSTVLLRAEGSRELISNGGNRAYLYSSHLASFSFPYPTRGTMKIYVKAGESIYVGSSAQGLVSGSVSLRAPDGNTYSSGNSTTVGLIANLSQELAGPLPAAGGYTPYKITVLANQEGIWEIDFVSPNSNSTANPAVVAANMPWTQTAGAYITAFDVSVRNAANTDFLRGRVFTNVFVGILGNFNVGFNAVLHILTKDGYQYTVDNNGQAGNGFSFFVNNKGFRDAAGFPSYKSIDNVSGINIHDPRAADTQADITHKIFFNKPAADMPLSAKAPGGSITWLLSTPVIAGISDFSFKTTVSSRDLPQGIFTFNSAGGGNYLIRIDVDGNGKYDDPVDRQMPGNSVAGLNEISWNGLDGQGKQVRVIYEATYTAEITLTTNSGEVHFPFFDVERNTNGIRLTRVNGVNAPDYNLYWDDSLITGPGTASSPLKNLTGLNSQVNGHKWGNPTNNPNNDADFGNNKSIDTWGYIVNEPLIIKLGLTLYDVSLEVPVVVPNVFTPNNDGKNDLFHVTGLEQFPGSKLNVFNRWGNAVYQSENYLNDWNGNNLAEGTYFYILSKREHGGLRTVTKGWVYIKR